MKISTLLFSLILFELGTSLEAQTPNHLRRVLGNPTTEVFYVNSDISVTVNYDSHRKVCDIKVAGNYLSAVRFADVLVPVGARGRQLGPPVSLIPAMDCCESWAYEYEKLTLAISSGTGQPTVRFVFKDRDCSVKQPPLRQPERFSEGAITPVASANKENSANRNRIYNKYETTQPAVILDLPVPELTPEAIARQEPGEMIIGAVLTPSGEVKDIVRMGSLKNGMADRSLIAARKIKFKPAILDGKPVSQRILIKYSVQKCAGDRMCTLAVEILDYP
jgi:Gram-negative bacterial TonB protein C-terminal